MRIRKSQLLFPFSSLSPPSLSDPHPINPSPVVQLDDDINPSPQSTLSDHPPPPDRVRSPIGKPTYLSDDSSGVTLMAKYRTGAQRQPEKQSGLEEDGRGRGEEGDQKGNDTRKGGISGSQTVADHVVLPSSPSNNQDERWCEGEKAIPLKKRRGSFERIKAETYDEVTQNNTNKKEKTRMKTKMNKKCSRQNEDDEEKVVVEEERERETKRERNAGRKRARGSAVMEGSRCSRVNGRGWRCCQQTLVGYSLCEHHLGKGRLRSITSVKTRSLPATATCSQKPEPQLLSQVSPSSSSVIKQTNEFEQDQEQKKKPEIVAKKRMKLGVVKARSMSSLLGQPSTHVAMLENNK